MTGADATFPAKNSFGSATGRESGAQISTPDILINCARKPRSLRVITERLRLLAVQDFLKPRIVPKRIPLPTYRKSESEIKHS